jgi:hypothetical protein
MIWIPGIYSQKHAKCGEENIVASNRISYRLGCGFGNSLEQILDNSSILIFHHFTIASHIAHRLNDRL